MTVLQFYLMLLPTASEPGNEKKLSQEDNLGYIYYLFAFQIVAPSSNVFVNCGKPLRAYKAVSLREVPCIVRSQFSSCHPGDSCLCVSISASSVFLTFTDCSLCCILAFPHKEKGRNCFGCLSLFRSLNKIPQTGWFRVNRNLLLMLGSGKTKLKAKADSIASEVPHPQRQYLILCLTFLWWRQNGSQGLLV